MSLHIYLTVFIFFSKFIVCKPVFSTCLSVQCDDRKLYHETLFHLFYPDPATGTVTGQFGVLCSDGAFVQPTAWPLETACVITDTWYQFQLSL